MRNLIKKIKAIPNTIWDFVLNILAVGLQWVTIVIMFLFNFAYKIWIETVHLIGECLIGIADFLESLRNILDKTLTVCIIIALAIVTIILLIVIIPMLIWLIGGTVFGIGWLLMLAGTFMMAHLIAAGIIILLMIIIIVILAIL